MPSSSLFSDIDVSLFQLFLLKYCYYSVVAVDRIAVLDSQYGLCYFRICTLYVFVFLQKNYPTIRIFQFHLLLSLLLISSASPILVWNSFVCDSCYAVYARLLNNFFHLCQAASLHLKIYFQAWKFLISREMNDHYPDYDLPEMLGKNFCSCWSSFVVTIW